MEKAFSLFLRLLLELLLRPWRLLGLPLLLRGLLRLLPLRLWLGLRLRLRGGRFIGPVPYYAVEFACRFRGRCHRGGRLWLGSGNLYGRACRGVYHKALAVVRWTYLWLPRLCLGHTYGYFSPARCAEFCSVGEFSPAIGTETHGA